MKSNDSLSFAVPIYLLKETVTDLPEETCVDLENLCMLPLLDILKYSVPHLLPNDHPR